MKAITHNGSGSFTILQLTDLHLMNQSTDLQTFMLIKKMVDKTHPQLIVITGDMTMSKDHFHLDQQLSSWMTSLAIPWTFVFGNHDGEGPCSKEELAKVLCSSPYCLYESEKDISGVGNHQIIIEREQSPWVQLFMLDSHSDRVDEVQGEKVWSYDYIKQDQIDWMINSMQQIPAILFFHIPIPEFLEGPANLSFQGEIHESICTSKYNSQLFERVKLTKRVLGIFVGHDHVNDFSFSKDEILLAYGRCSGYYNYTMPEFIKGGRVICLDENLKLTTKTIKSNEV